MERQEKIIKTSIIGIVVNLILVAFKAFVGIMTNSIAITLDAVNNLTDALSSIITVIGAKLAHRPPDKNHPYGYGRIEYFSSVIIVAIVLWAGFTALLESYPKIWNPDVTNYTPVSLVIIAVAIVVKLALGQYVKRVGEDINSQALVASGSDALFDSILSLSTLVAALISIFFHISLEGILGIIISIVIIKASFDMLKETVNSMLGARVASDLSVKIKESICELPEVYGAYDLNLHNYGPEEMRGSVHIEVDDTLTALDIHKLTRRIQIKIFQEFSIGITVGIYARNDKYQNVRNYLEEIAGGYDEISEIHGFIVFEDENLVMFDTVVEFGADRKRIQGEIVEKLKAKYPQFNYEMICDDDVSD
jgi:cation diffusion facilitator family transporter